MPKNKRNDEKQPFFRTVLSVDLEDDGEGVDVAIICNKQPLEDPWMMDIISNSLAEVMVNEKLVGRTICDAFGQYLELVLGKEASNTIFTMMSVIMKGYDHAEAVAGELFNFKPKSKE